MLTLISLTQRTATSEQVKVEGRLDWQTSPGTRALRVNPMNISALEDHTTFTVVHLASGARFEVTEQVVAIEALIKKAVEDMMAGIVHIGVDTAREAVAADFARDLDAHGLDR